VTPDPIAVRPDLSFVLVDGEGVVLDEAHGQVHVLNGSAASLWNLLQNGTTVLELTERLREGHDVPVQRLCCDVRSLLEELDAKGLLAPPPPEAAVDAER
jgi:hypothetical protein